MGSFSTGGNYRSADPRLVAIAQAAAAMSPYNVVLFSGERGGNSSSQHSGGNAIDIVLIDPQTGQEVPNLGAGGAAFDAYQTFAQGMRQAQQRIAPDLANNFRWGGYFGPTGLNPTGLDLMHFDLGPTQNMALGTWEGGLNDNGRQFVANAGNGQIYSATQRAPAPMAYATPSGGSAGQAAIAGATGTGDGLPAAPDAPAGSQRLFRSVSDAREARAAGGTPRLDEISSIIQARRMGDRPLLDRLRNFFQERGTPVLDAIRGDNQPTASTGGSSGGGSQGDPNIRRIQEQLKAAGFDPGPIDGLMGNRTRTAVRQFQQANGLQVDGDPGPRTQAALAATAAPMPLPRDNPARMPQQPTAQARLDYTAPVRPAGLPSMPTGPAPGSMPGMGALPQAGPRGQVPMGNFGAPIAQAGMPSMPSGPSAGSLPGLMPMRDPSRLATPPPGNGLGVSLRTGTGASVNSQPLGQVPGAPDPYDELFQWAASRAASDNARRAMQSAGGVLPSAGSGIIGTPPQGVLGGFSGPRPWGTEAPPMQRFPTPITPPPQTRMVASTNEQPTPWMDMQQRQSGVMPAARDDLNPYRNAMNLPSYWNAPQMQPGGPGTGGNPVQTTSMPGMTSPPMNGIPPAFWRLFMGTGV